MTTAPLLPDPQPATITVNGTGLIAWGERAKTGEVHIYRMICVDGGYKLSLLWLEGRKLEQLPKQFATTEVKRMTTLASIGQSAEPSKGLDRPVNEPLMQKPSAVKSASPIGNPDANILKPLRPSQQHAAVQEALKLFR